MKVLIVCNNAYISGNGLHTAIHAQLRNLKRAGVDVRLMATENAEKDGAQPDFPLKHFHVLLFEPIVYANGFRFSLADRRKIRKAVEWADVVHLLECFPLQMRTLKIAKKLGKPCIATLHLFPQNVITNLFDVGGEHFLNKALMYFWKKGTLNGCDHIHCPSQTAADFLRRSGVTVPISVISNGITLEGRPEPDFVKLPSEEGKGVVNILTIGRNAREKDQKILLEAMNFSKHAGRIQLLFAGKGPLRKKLERQANQLFERGVLKHKVIFGFYSKTELQEIIRKAYLYIHCAWVEIEGLSCIEAIREGVVPIIAEGPYTATSQFALDERSRFPVKDAKTLAERIDWWIEHPQEHARMRPEYVKSLEAYDERKTTEAMIDLYQTLLK